MAHHDVHLICGSTGAGKTTYALDLEQRMGAMRFSIDEWMDALFWADSPQPLDPAWSMERVERCLGQIARTAMRVAACGVPCILDLGFSQAQSRRRFVRLARDLGLSVQLHFIDTPAPERWLRVQSRNTQGGEARQLAFDISREMFDFVEGLWEPPTDEEMAACDGVRV